MNVDQPLDDIIKQNKATNKTTRGGRRRERGRAFSRRNAQFGRAATLAQARGREQKAPPQNRRRFGATGLLQAPNTRRFARPQFITSYVPASAQQPSAPQIVVLPVATTGGKGQGGRGNQPTLSNAARRLLSQQISQISPTAGPIQFPTHRRMRGAPPRSILSTPRAQNQQRRRASKVVRQSVQSSFTYIPAGSSLAPMMMMPAGPHMMMAPQGPRRLGRTGTRGLGRMGPRRHAQREWN